MTLFGINQFRYDSLENARRVYFLDDGEIVYGCRCKIADKTDLLCLYDELRLKASEYVLRSNNIGMKIAVEYWEE